MKTYMYVSIMKLKPKSKRINARSTQLSQVPFRRTKATDTTPPTTLFSLGSKSKPPHTYTLVLNSSPDSTTTLS